MQTTPTVSVIMPAHDAERYLGEAIESVLGQTHADLELIVIDDASRDGTADVIARYVHADARVKMLQVEVGSAAEARNAGLAQAQGRFVALLDADDVAYPDRLKKQLAAAAEVPEAVLWGCYMRRVTSEGIPMDTVRVGSRSVEEFARLDRTRSLIRLYGTAALFPRELALRSGGFDRRFEPLEDSELWDRLAQHGPALVVPEILMDYRQHDQSLSVKKIHLQRKWFRFITRRHAARLQGADFTLAEFDREYGSGSPLREFDASLRAFSQLHGRRYRIARARREYAAAALSCLLMLASHPGRFLRRLFPGAPHV